MMREQAQHILKVLVYEENPHTLSEIRHQLAQVSEVHITSSCKLGFDIIAHGVDKIHAIQCVCAHQDIPLEYVIAIGDGENDLQMLSLAGLGVAMGNACSEVQAHADVIAPTNDDDGVAWILRHYA